MAPTGWHLAQVNIAVLLAPIDSEQHRGSVEMLEPIKAIADAAPGFVWRLQTEDGDATSIRAFEDDRIIVNLSVWESSEALGDFVFATRHLELLRRRREWFEKMATAYVAMWWIPADTIPTVEDAKARLELLEARGPSPEAFTLRKPFPPPGSDEPVVADDRWLSPAW